VKEEHRLRVFKNEVFKKIFAPKMEDVTGRKLFDEDLHECYSSQHITGVTKSRKMRRMGFVTRREGRREMRT
jgi:hypothetical protein